MARVVEGRPRGTRRRSAAPSTTDLWLATPSRDKLGELLTISHGRTRPPASLCAASARDRRRSTRTPCGPVAPPPSGWSPSSSGIRAVRHARRAQPRQRSQTCISRPSPRRGPVNCLRRARSSRRCAALKFAGGEDAELPRLRGPRASGVPARLPARSSRARRDGFRGLREPWTRAARLGGAAALRRRVAHRRGSKG